MERELLLHPERCILCHACEVACAREHDGRTRAWVVTIDGGGVPLFCRHCETAPCATVCPTGALEKARGEVLLHPDLCTGCELCLWACPFGVVALQGGKAYKCDLCAHRREWGGEPACALTCPSGAITYRYVADLGARRRAVAGLGWAAGAERRGR